jgi:hypothetical protein
MRQMDLAGTVDLGPNRWLVARFRGHGKKLPFFTKERVLPRGVRRYSKCYRR